MTAASIVGGAGNDSVTFTFASANSHGTNAAAAVTNTYFFGSSGGLDTIEFANNSTKVGTAALTIAVDSSYGATSSMTFTSATSLISIGSGASIFVKGVTGTSSAAGQLTSNLGFTLTTVSSSIITDLG